MTRYFMRDTPLCQIEQQMMTPPYFKPRGHGRYSRLSQSVLNGSTTQVPL